MKMKDCGKRIESANSLRWLRAAPSQARTWPRHRMTKNTARSVYLLIASIVVVLDRWTKHLVAQRIALYAHVQVIPGFFRITHTENTGAAFSLFADSTGPWKTALLISFSTIAMVVVLVLLWKNQHTQMVTGVALSLILGGAVGNLWDRLARGRVI